MREGSGVFGSAICFRIRKASCAWCPCCWGKLYLRRSLQELLRQVPISLTLADALSRAKANSPQFQAALTDLGLAREDRVQARAALLPGVNYNNSFIYTQGNARCLWRVHRQQWRA